MFTKFKIGLNFLTCVFLQIPFFIHTHFVPHRKLLDVADGHGINHKTLGQTRQITGSVTLKRVVVDYIFSLVYTWLSLFQAQ